jgi:hypothetical protein
LFWPGGSTFALRIWTLASSRPPPSPVRDLTGSSPLVALHSPTGIDVPVPDPMPSDRRTVGRDRCRPPMRFSTPPAHPTRRIRFPERSTTRPADVGRRPAIRHHPEGWLIRPVSFDDPTVNPHCPTADESVVVDGPPRPGHLPSPREMVGVTWSPPVARIASFTSAAEAARSLVRPRREADAEACPLSTGVDPHRAAGPEARSLARVIRFTRGPVREPYPPGAPNSRPPRAVSPGHGPPLAARWNELATSSVPPVLDRLAVGAEILPEGRTSVLPASTTSAQPDARCSSPSGPSRTSAVSRGRDPCRRPHRG